MSKIYRFTCIVCPLGCYVEAELEGDTINIRGCKCPRGEEWVKEEILDPKRVVMSVIKVKNGEYPVVSVKTDAPVPKEKIPDIMRYISRLEVSAPVKRGDIIVRNILGLQANLVATRDVMEK